MAMTFYGLAPEHLPPRADGVTVNGRDISLRQWDGINTPIGHERRLVHSIPFIYDSEEDLLLGHFALKTEAALRRFIRQRMKWRRVPADEAVVDRCVKELVAVCQLHGLPGIGVTLKGWDKLVDEAV